MKFAAAHCKFVNWLEELPPSLQLGRDLWPRIAEQLSQPFVQTTPARALRRRIFRLIISAAAILVAAVGTVFLHDHFSTSGPNTIRVESSGSSIESTTRAEIAKAEQTYLEAANGLLVELDSDKTRLSSEARDILDRNLAITDQAISEVTLALKERPSDFALARKLLATHERRIELLEQATQLSFASRNGG